MHDNEKFEAIIKTACEKHGFQNPVDLLIGLSNGVDLTKKSVVYDFIKQLENEYGEDELPDEFDYSDLVELIKEQYKFEFVDVELQMKAQKTLVEYQHSKRKAIEVSVSEADGKIMDLKESEVDLFWSKFNAKY